MSRRRSQIDVSSRPLHSCNITKHNGLLLYSYIARLTPQFVKALAVTAPWSQVDALRDAISKHLTLETSFRVQIPVSHSFQLQQKQILR